MFDDVEKRYYSESAASVVQDAPVRAECDRGEIAVLVFLPYVEEDQESERRNRFDRTGARKETVEDQKFRNLATLRFSYRYAQYVP